MGLYNDYLKGPSKASIMLMFFPKFNDKIVCVA
jgi:hypothetical protein